MKTRATMILAARAAIADGRLPNEEALDVAVERMMDSPEFRAFRAAHPRVPESAADRAMLAGAERVALDPEAARDGRRGRA